VRNVFKDRTRYKDYKKGKGRCWGPECVHAYMRMPICTALFEQMCVYRSFSGRKTSVGLSETSGLAMSGGSESSVRVCTAVRRWRRPAADTGSQEPPSYLKTLDFA